MELAWTECDHAGSAGDQVASTSPNQAASAAKSIQRASRANPDRRVCSGEGPLRTLREAREGAAGILAMESLELAGCLFTDFLRWPHPNTPKYSFWARGLPATPLPFTRRAPTSNQR